MTPIPRSVLNGLLSCLLLPSAALGSVGLNEPLGEFHVAGKISVPSETELLPAGNETNDACGHGFN
jgi:hypothetical protein